MRRAFNPKNWTSRSRPSSNIHVLIFIANGNCGGKISSLNNLRGNLLNNTFLLDTSRLLCRSRGWSWSTGRSCLSRSFLSCWCSNDRFGGNLLRLFLRLLLLGRGATSLFSSCLALTRAFCSKGIIVFQTYFRHNLSHITVNANGIFLRFFLLSNSLSKFLIEEFLRFFIVNILTFGFSVKILVL